MNAISPRLPSRSIDAASFRLAALTGAFLVLAGDAQYGRVVSALNRTVLRQPCLSSYSGPALDRLLERIERRLCEAIAELEGEAVAEVRYALDLCSQRGANLALREAVAFAVNADRGYPLPTETLNFLVAESATVS